MRIVCQQTILMKYHALFVIFEKAAKFEMQIIGGALRVKTMALGPKMTTTGVTREETSIQQISIYKL